MNYEAMKKACAEINKVEIGVAINQQGIDPQAVVNALMAARKVIEKEIAMAEVEEEYK